MQSFVALDLELTPYSSDHHRIIEVAAVRFRSSTATDSFSTLVDPQCDLDFRIGALTGICQEEVNTAPSLREIIPRLLAFIGDDPVVGQSIHLDVEQLAACGVRLDNKLYDTFELASLLLPGLPSYDLATIARHLGVEQEKEHRALGDALVAGRVLLALLDVASGLEVELLSRIDALASQVPEWSLADLFRAALRRRTKNYFVSPHPGGSPSIDWVDKQTTTLGVPSKSLVSTRSGGATPREMEPCLFPLPGNSSSKTSLHPSPHFVAIDPQELRSLLGPGGRVAEALGGFEEREEQVRMMSAVADAMNSKEHLLVEAGTGTGKSLAYLLPAIHFAVSNGRSVIVSTNTVNLQDQLFHKDIPALQSCLPVAFKVALLKGRANYLCLRRWIALSRSPGLTPEEQLLLIKTLIWIARSETGDKAELNMSASDAALWTRISAQSESCAMSRCPHFRQGSCFVARARRNAQNAHIVIVNHALLLSDLAVSGGILPEYSHLVVDEAHHLEAEATEQLSFTLSWGDLTFNLRSLYHLTSGQWPTGFLPELGSALRQKEIPPETWAGIRNLLSETMGAVERALEQGGSFFEALLCFLQDHVDNRSRAAAPIRITSAVRVQPGWSEIEVRWSELADKLLGLRRLLYRLGIELDMLEDSQILEREGLIAEIAGYQTYLDQQTSHGEEIISSPTPDGIYWIQGATETDRLALRSAPLHVGEALNGALFSCKDTVVLTSATLTTEGSFDYVRERLGLEDARELMVGSPFDYEQSTMLYIVQDIPEPARPACQRTIETTIADTVLAMGGRTLVLFTSHAHLRQTNGAIRSRLEQEGVLVLAHGLDGSRRRLLQAFRGSSRAVLMGTSSFWEGIDVVGEALSCLIIVKLPFSVPTDPIFEARSETFDEPFRQFSVPQTILRFKQGFGRLIRSRTDRGVVVILDSRVGSKFYGPSFIQSLPRCTVRRGPAAHVAEKARAWLGSQ